MKPRKKTSCTRHGKRADGITLLSVAIPKATKRNFQVIAEQAGHTVSSMLRVVVQNYVRKSNAARSGLKQRAAA